MFTVYSQKYTVHCNKCTLDRSAVWKFIVLITVQSVQRVHTVYGVNCTLYILYKQSKLYTVYCVYTVHSVKCTLYSVYIYGIVSTVYCIVWKQGQTCVKLYSKHSWQNCCPPGHTLYCTVYVLKYSVNCTVQYKLCCTVYILTVYSVHLKYSSYYIVHCTIWSIIYTLHCIQYCTVYNVVHSIQYCTVYNVVHSIHSTLSRFASSQNRQLGKFPNNGAFRKHVKIQCFGLQYTIYSV